MPAAPNTIALNYRTDTHSKRPRGRCLATFFHPTLNQPSGLIVVTETDDNPSLSITNAIEWIAQTLDLNHLNGQLNHYYLVEHYRPNRWRGPTYDLVWFENNNNSYYSQPRWRRLTAEQIDALASDSDVLPTLYLSDLPSRASYLRGRQSERAFA